MLRSVAAALLVVAAVALATPVQRLSHHEGDPSKAEDNMTTVNQTFH